jgi:alanyl-tRNA synthetase
MELNEHNKKEYPPMHTAEHLLNQTMVRMFGCDRSKSSHIERKKSKCDYFLSQQPTPEQIADIENAVNAQIQRNLDVNDALVDRDHVPASVDLSKLPENASETLRLVYVGDYDVCACIGAHVNNTSEIGCFRIISTDYTEGKLRIRFKLEDCLYTE